MATLTGSDYLDDLLTVRNFANSELVVAFSGVMTGCPSPWCTHRCSHSHWPHHGEVQNHWHGVDQGCIFCLTCSYPELTKNHVLTSAFVEIFRTVTKNAVNKSV